MKKFSHRCAGGLITSFVTTIILTAASTQLLAHDNHGAVQTDGRFTPNVEGAEFPPQPRRVENARQHIPIKRTEAQRRNFQRMLDRVVNNADVQGALGERYAHIHTAPYQTKGRRSGNRYRLVFFSHSNNQTVNIVTAGNSVRSLDIIPANEEQPALGQSEHADSIELARQYWLERGKSSVETLRAYAIQTFQADGSPYPTRMVYVSFHVNSPEAPLLYNWVDLTNEEVVTGEEE